jgi:hypothetical protein
MVKSLKEAILAANARGYSKIQIAEASGVTTPTVHNIVNGRNYTVLTERRIRAGIKKLRGKK